MNQPELQPDNRVQVQFDRIQRWGLIVGGVGMVLALIGAFFKPSAIFPRLSDCLSFLAGHHTG